MGLTDSELAELRELQARAYGRHQDGALDDISRKRLLELEQSQSDIPDGQQVADEAVEDRVAPVLSDEGGEHVDLAESAGDSYDAAPRRRPVWAVAFLAGAAGIAVGLLIPLGLDALRSPDSAYQVIASDPEIPMLEDWDAQSIRYLATFRTAQFWLATHDGGETTCLVIDDPTGNITPSMRTCKPTAVALEVGLTWGSVAEPEEGPADAPSTVHLFSVSFSGEDPTMTLVERVTDDPQGTVRQLLGSSRGSITGAAMRAGAEVHGT